MIAELSGTIGRVGADFAVIDVGGVGYKVFVPLSVMAELPPVGSQTKLFTFTYVKEDALTLYGFSDPEQQSVFELLLTVSGVGPKVALNVLSVLPVDSLVDAIARDDYHSLVRIPGIGTKTAQRIVLELKEKTASLALEKRAARPAAAREGAALDDLVDGLAGLGYNRNDARQAVEQAMKSIGHEASTSALVREALKLLTKR